MRPRLRLFSKRKQQTHHLEEMNTTANVTFVTVTVTATPSPPPPLPLPTSPPTDWWEYEDHRSAALSLYAVFFSVYFLWKKNRTPGAFPGWLHATLNFVALVRSGVWSAFFYH
ncbi:hypothetical protein PG988_004524 [Apiospora saccharicola]